MKPFSAGGYSVTSPHDLWKKALLNEWDEHQPGTLNTRGIGLQRVTNAPNATPSGVIYTDQAGRIEGWVNGAAAYIVSED